MQHFRLLIPDSISLKRHRRLHGSQAEQLHHVVRNHVTQCARGVEIPAALLDTDSLRIRDLYVIDVPPVPDRLEDRVVETEHEYVLHRLFAEIVIDAVNLVLRQDRLDLPVESARRFQIAPKRLLDYDPPPFPVVLPGQLALSQLLHNRSKKFRGDREIKKIISVRRILLIKLPQ